MTTSKTTSRTLRTIAVVAAAALIAAACGGDDPDVVQLPAETTSTTVAEQPSSTLSGLEQPVPTTTVVAMTEEQREEIHQEIVEVVENASPEDVPSAEIVEQVIEAAAEAAPESELNLGICTQWVADHELILNDVQAEECAAMLVAAMEACEGLNCFGDDGIEPEPEPEETPSTTTPPEPESEEPTTTSAPSQWETATEVEEPTTSTTPPEPEEVDPEAETEEQPTTTVPPEQPVEEPEAEAAVETSTSDWIAPYVGLVPEVHPDTPPTSWERGGLQPVGRPLETPRSTGTDRVQVAEWINWMGGADNTYTQWLMGYIKWALDYLGAHPACVINTYYDRVVTSNEVTLPGPSRTRLSEGLIRMA